MKNFRQNRRRFRNNTFDRGFKIHNNEQNFNSDIGNISDIKKRNFSRNNQNFSKLIQKYTDHAREALSIGDKISYENYMQHAEHFVRITDNATSKSNSLLESSDNLTDHSVKNLKNNSETKNNIQEEHEDI